MVPFDYTLMNQRAVVSFVGAEGATEVTGAWGENEMIVLSPLKIISIGVCIALIIGYVNRRRPRVHVPLMLAAFVVDLAMVVYIELARDAIASAQAKMGVVMIVHILISVAVLVLYVVQVVSGLANLRGRRSRRHGPAGKSLLVLRLGNLLTSFLVS